MPTPTKTRRTSGKTPPFLSHWFLLLPVFGPQYNLKMWCWIWRMDLGWVKQLSSEPEHSRSLKVPCSVPGTSMASEQARKMESLHNGSSWSKNLDCAKITASVILLTCTLFVIPFYIFFISNSLPLFVSLVLSHLKSSNRKISASTPTPTDQPAQPLPEAGGIQLFRILPTDGSHSNHGCPFQ